MHKKFLPLLFISVGLTSCGSSMSLFNHPGRYNSMVWKYNNYSVKDKEFLQAEARNNVELDYELDKVFESYVDPHFVDIEKDDFIYESEDYVLGYGPNKKLSQANDSFKLGVTSKLFDGIMFCGGRYENVRVQIDQDGFMHKFNAKCTYFDYFAINFKSSLDFKSYEEDIPEHKASFTLNISFLINDNGYKIDTYSYRIKDMSTNPKIELPSPYVYKFFGFSLARYNITNCEGIGISYSDLDDELNNLTSEKKDHSLFIYEILLPNSTWTNI